MNFSRDSAWLAPALALQSLLATACGQVLGVKDYRVGPGGSPDASSEHPDGSLDAHADSAVSDAPAGRLPDGGYRSPYRCGDIPLWNSECEACVHQGSTCTQMIQSCGLDPYCGAFDSCADLCGLFVDPTPGCFLQCQVRNQALGGFVSGPVMIPLWVGAAGYSCLYGPCKAGEQWDCVRRWDWPSFLPGQTAKIRVSLANLNPAGPAFSSFTVQLCSGSFPAGCGQPGQILSGPVTADAGIAELDVPLGWGPVPYLGTRPYLEIHAPSTRPILYYPGQPFLGEQSLSVTGLDDASGATYFEQGGIQVDPSKAIVEVFPIFDCTLGNPEGATVRGPPEAQIAYTDSILSGGNIHIGATGTARQFSAAFLTNLDAAGSDAGAEGRIVQVSVFSQPEHGSQEVVQESVEIRPGALTFLAGFPKTTER